MNLNKQNNNERKESYLGISYETWIKTIDIWLCNIPTEYNHNLQFYPLFLISDKDIKFLKSKEFFLKYIKNGKFLNTKDKYCISLLYMKQEDNTYRKYKLIPPLYWLIWKAIERELFCYLDKKYPGEDNTYYICKNYYNDLASNHSNNDITNKMKSVINKFEYIAKYDIYHFRDSINSDLLNNFIKNSGFFNLKQYTNFITFLDQICYNSIPFFPQDLWDGFIWYGDVYFRLFDKEVFKAVNNTMKNIGNYEFTRGADEYIILFNNSNQDSVEKIANIVKNCINNVINKYNLQINEKKFTISTINSKVNNEQKNSINNTLYKYFWKFQVNSLIRAISNFGLTLFYLIKNKFNKISNKDIQIIMSLLIFNHCTNKIILQILKKNNENIWNYYNLYCKASFVESYK